MWFKKSKKNAGQNEKKEPTYWERVIRGKGTVAEPWATAEELWDDPGFKQAMKNHRALIKQRNNT